MLKLTKAEKFLVADALNIGAHEIDKQLESPDLRQSTRDVLEHKLRTLANLRNRVLDTPASVCACGGDLMPGFDVCANCTVEAVDDMIAGRY